MSEPSARVCSTEVRGSWTVEHRRGTAAQLHAVHDIAGDRRLVQVNEVTGPALVLGSTQDDAVADATQLAARGVELARRRSGGGAVLLVPDEHVWVDVVIPRGDPLWSDDVTEAGWWLGERWAEAVGPRPGHPDPAVHRHGVGRRELGRLVCFAGVGPGEVVVAGRKLVGISQRRTRGWARFQSVVHRRWDPLATPELLAVRPDGLRSALTDEVTSLADLGVGTWDPVVELLELLEQLG